MAAPPAPPSRALLRGARDRALRRRDARGLRRTRGQRPSDTSVVAHLRTGRPGRTLAIRADIDALPIHEESGVEFASERDGVMHACGHDGHTAMLLGAAQELAARTGELSGELRFLFQPAEERATGRRDRARRGPARWTAWTSSWAATCGRRCRSGSSPRGRAPRWPPSDFFTLVITGDGGHAALPHTAVDTVAVAAQVITNLQHVVSRRTDPLQSAVLSVEHVPRRRCGQRPPRPRRAHRHGPHVRPGAADADARAAGERGPRRHAGARRRLRARLPPRLRAGRQRSGGRPSSSPTPCTRPTAASSWRWRRSWAATTSPST